MVKHEMEVSVSSVPFAELDVTLRPVLTRLRRREQIPSQRRFLFPIDLSPIEFAFYSDTFARALEGPFVVLR